MALLDPRLLTSVSLSPFALRATEDLFVFSTILWVALTRRRGLLTVYSLAVVLLLPLMLGVLLFLLAGASPWEPPPAAYVLFCLFPSTLDMVFPFLDAPEELALATVLLAAASQAAFLAWVSRRMEVA